MDQRMHTLAGDILNLGKVERRLHDDGEPASARAPRQQRDQPATGKPGRLARVALVYGAVGGIQVH